MISTSFCTPGPSSNLAPLPPDLWATLDAMVGMLDSSVSHPSIAEWLSSGVLSDLAAKVWGAPHAAISQGGSSVANVAVLGHVVRRATPKARVVIVDRLSHQSVHGGIITAGLDVVWIERRVEGGCALPLHPDDVARAITDVGAHNVAAVHHTVCAYGVGRDPTAEAALHALCKRHGILLCVDAAWAGTHGLFPGLPPSPHDAADITVLSPHKKGLTPQPLGVVLFRRADTAALYEDAMRTGLATTSPSFVLLALAEARLRALRDGAMHAGWDRAVARATALRAALRPAGWLGSSHRALCEDPTHVFLRCPKGRGGKALQAALLERGVTAEAAFEDSVLLLVMPGQTCADARLLDALADLEGGPFEYAVNTESST